jgi:helix-turn-helix protein
MRCDEKNVGRARVRERVMLDPTSEKASAVNLARNQTNKRIKQHMTKRKRVKDLSDTGEVGAFKMRPACRYVGGVSQYTMKRLIESGQIVPCRNLRHLLIPKSELDRWLREGQFAGKGGAHHK